MPEAELAALLSSRPALLGEAAEWGVHDTVVRGKLVNVITEALVGAKWPTYGDTQNGVDFDAFVAQVNESAAARGWAVRQH